MQQPTPPTSRRELVAQAALRKWRSDPVALARDLFDFRPWSRQAELLEAVATHDRVSCRSGHKCGKTASVAILALWWGLTRHEARVILLAPTYRQIAELVWREIKAFYHRRAKVPLGGEAFSNPEQGIRWRDGRQIIGFSTDRKEQVAGYSGNILYVIDEASGVPDEVHEVVATSPAGKVVMISNPTRSSGAFYESHHSRREHWHTLAISSEEAARENPLFEGPDGSRRPLVRGLADQDWVEARRAEYGAEGYWYDVRVRGQFARQGDNAMISLGLVEAARARWTSEPPTEGRTTIGVDPARFGPDDTAIVWSRGRWCSLPIVVHGNDNVSIATQVLRLAADIRRLDERPLVRVDQSNNNGVADILRRSESIEVEDVMSQEAATVRGYARLRDQVWAGARTWLAEGGMLPPDEELVGDLVAPTYDTDERGRLKVEGKRELRRRLGRSTDRADAFCLAVYSDGESAVVEQVLGSKIRMPRARW